jgi:hypothetical protein
MPPFNNQMDSPVEIERRNSEPGQSKIKPLPEYLSRHYDKLPTRPDNRGAIRLLNLISSDPNNPNVECELITPKDDPSDPTWKIPYEALSWCWGAPDRTQYIRIRKGQKTYAKYVSANLFSALRALRDDQNNRHLWIDAVCMYVNNHRSWQ